MKILYVTTIGGTMVFFRRLIRELVNEGHTVEIATNDTTSKVQPEYSELGCPVHTISCSRSPLSKDNLNAYKQLKKLIDENDYDIVHCHTPVAAMLTRLAARRARKKKGTKVFYTAHGFHFYKGAPKKNWLIYFPIEWLCAFFTDVLININKDDYKFATKHIKAKKVAYIPGVGIDTALFKRNNARDKVRKELSIPEDATLLVSVGELNENKNHKCVINAIKDLDVYYIIAGKGPKDKELQTLIDDSGLTDRVKLLGFRRDVLDLYSASDIFAFPSFREGLPVSVMEAMSTGLPVICSKIRGSVDLIDYRGGELFDPRSSESCKKSLETLLLRDLEPIGENNKEKVKEFDFETVNEMMKEIYFG